jgi:hypothetical protein
MTGVTSTELRTLETQGNVRWVEADRGPGAPNFDLKEQGSATFSG